MDYQNNDEKERELIALHEQHSLLKRLLEQQKQVSDYLIIY